MVDDDGKAEVEKAFQSRIHDGGKRNFAPYPHQMPKPLKGRHLGHAERSLTKGIDLS